MPDDPVTAVRTHRNTVHDGDERVFASCCEQIALDAVRAALARDSARLSLQAAALAPWRET